MGNIPNIGNCCGFRDYKADNVAAAAVVSVGGDPVGADRGAAGGPSLYNGQSPRSLAKASSTHKSGQRPESEQSPRGHLAVAGVGQGAAAIKNPAALQRTDGSFEPRQRESDQLLANREELNAQEHRSLQQQVQEEPVESARTKVGSPRTKASSDGKATKVPESIPVAFGDQGCEPASPIWSLAFEVPKATLMEVKTPRCRSTASTTTPNSPEEDTKLDMTWEEDTKLTLADLEYIRVLARGGFGSVAIVQRGDTRYALKRVRKRGLKEEDRNALVNELGILKEVSHPFIVKFVQSFRNQHSVYFLTELLAGSLADWPRASPAEACFYIGGAILALEWLHARCIVHNDVKRQNILVDQQGYIKLTDFGCALRLDQEEHYQGTPYFFAPERLEWKSLKAQPESDLWSLGILLYEFVLGAYPFGEGAQEVILVFRQIRSGTFNFPSWFHSGYDVMADDTVSLINGLLTMDPKRRLGAGDEGYAKLKAHSFFKGLCWKKLMDRKLQAPFAPKCHAEDIQNLHSVEEEEARCASQEEPWQEFLVKPLLDFFTWISSTDLEESSSWDCAF